MNEIIWLNILKNTSLICNGIGLLIALAFLFGPKVLMAISNILDTPRTTLSLEKILITKARVTLGFVLLVVSIMMLAMVINIRI